LDITAQVKDSSVKIKIDTVTEVVSNKNQYNAVLDSNIFLSYKGASQALEVTLKKLDTSEYLFYIFAALFLWLGLLRAIYSRYFNTMFRVFFNTSLRQNQLTDQLEQAALPSLLFNIFFVFSMGLYIYILYEHNNIYHNVINWTYLGLCVLAVAICYLVKYVSLLFTGWLTNHKPEARIYVFSIFLLNKIIGMLLLPFTLLIAFSSYKIANYATIISLIFLSILLLSRFFKTYGLLQNRLKLNGIHFGYINYF
jgi:magnesium-transporting ATPase (P-type)